MTLNSAFDSLQENASKPRFCKSLSLGETWKSKSTVSLDMSTVSRQYSLVLSFLSRNFEEILFCFFLFLFFAFIFVNYSWFCVEDDT